MDIAWNDAQLFLAIAEGRSVSAAARKLRVAQPTVSRKLSELEARLGEPLFVRGAAGTVPTPFGERLLEPARRMAEWAGELGRLAAGRADAPEGRVRVTAPPGVAFDFVVPFAAWLRERLPSVELEVVSSVEYLDLSRREADLALRLQPPTSRDLVSLASLEHEVGVFVSEGYAARLGPRPKLDAVGFIAWAPPRDHLSPNPELSAKIPGFRPAFASDDYLVQLRAAELGLGAIFLGRVRHRFSRPRGLVEIPIDLGGPIRRALHLVCARSALHIPRVRAVADKLAAEIARTVRLPPPEGRREARRAR
jgi:DNA-binding transcriptional LysR family regulator